MGYDLHISRREYWHDEDGPEISLDEWQAYAAQRADLVPCPVRDADGTVIADSGARGAFGVQSEPGEWWILDWSRGTVTTSRPPQDIIRIMVAMAQDLNARVLGDDDEDYGPDGEAVEWPHAAPERKRNWLSRLLGR